MIDRVTLPRRKYRQFTILILSGFFLFSSCGRPDKPKVYGHLWVYASQFPPDWNSNPVLEKVFLDFKYSGMDGLEIMDANLRDPEIVGLLKPLIEAHNLPVIGASYYGDMWNPEQEHHILKDAEIVISRLAEVGGIYLGITVGDAGRKKTEKELDQQAKVLKQIIKICKNYHIIPNLHNHTFELDYDQYDFLGTIERVPEIQLGPDINWMIRAGVDPVGFIQKHGNKIIFLHLRDQYPNGLWTNYIGQGETDFPEIKKALEKARFSGDVAIELAYEKHPDHPIRDDLKKSRDYVREVFKW